jgi:hypothetical protein
MATEPDYATARQRVSNAQQAIGAAGAAIRKGDMANALSKNQAAALAVNTAADELDTVFAAWQATEDELRGQIASMQPPAPPSDPVRWGACHNPPHPPPWTNDEILGGYDALEAKLGGALDSMRIYSPKFTTNPAGDGVVGGALKRGKRIHWSFRIGGLGTWDEVGDTSVTAVDDKLNALAANLAAMGDAVATVNFEPEPDQNRKRTTFSMVQWQKAHARVYGALSGHGFDVVACLTGYDFANRAAAWLPPSLPMDGIAIDPYSTGMVGDLAGWVAFAKQRSMPLWMIECGAALGTDNGTSQAAWWQSLIDALPDSTVQAVVVYDSDYGGSPAGGTWAPGPKACQVIAACIAGGGGR